MWVEHVVGEQPADLVAAEAPPRAVGLRDRRAEAVGVGVVGERQQGAAARRPASITQVHRPRLLRVREGDRRERRVGLELLGDHVRRRQPGGVERPQHDRRRRRRASACRRRGRRSPPGAAGRDRIDVDVAVDERPRRAARSSGSSAAAIGTAVGSTAAMRSAMLGVVRAARSGRRRRGTPCSRCRPAGCATPSPSRRRPRRARSPPTPAPASAAGRAAGARGTPGRRHHPRRVEGEDVALAAGVVADDDAALARRRARRRAGSRRGPRAAWRTTSRFIRSGPAPIGGAQPGGAEHQLAVEARGELVVGPVEQRLQLGADVVVGLGGEPALGDLARAAAVTAAAYAARRAAAARRG